VRVLVIASLVAAVGFVGFRTVERHRDEHRFASIASAIAGRKVSIHCQTIAGELVDVSDRFGSVDFDRDGHPGPRADLKRATCQALARLAHGRHDTLENASIGVEVLAHEAYHLAGFRDEAVAECYGLQAMTFVARRLGVSPERAAALVAIASERLKTLPQEYQSLECREGGALDLHPETGVFP
jgi:hypothetical protein